MGRTTSPTSGPLTPPLHRIRTDHQRRKFFISLAFLFVTILVVLNVAVGLRGVSSTSKTPIRLKSYSSKRFSEILDHLFYQGDDGDGEGGSDEKDRNGGRGETAGEGWPSSGVVEDGSLEVESNNNALRGAVTITTDKAESEKEGAGGPLQHEEDAEEVQLLKRKHQKWQFAEDVAAELSVYGDSMVAHGHAFNEHVLSVAAVTAASTGAKGAEGGGGGGDGGDADADFSTCEYFREGSKLKRHDYSHRKKRKGEYRTAEYFDAVRTLILKEGSASRSEHNGDENEKGGGATAEVDGGVVEGGVAFLDGNGEERTSSALVVAMPSSSGGDQEEEQPEIDNARSPRGPNGEAVWIFSPRIPTVLNHFPISISDVEDLNISKPFGAWKSVFFPVDALMSEQQDAPIPKYLRPPQVIEAAPPLYAAVVQNAFLSQGHLVTCDGNVLTSGGCVWDFSLRPSPRHREKARRVLIGIPLCDKWCNGFYHFTHEHLPRLALVHSLLVNPRREAEDGVRLVLSHAPNAFQRGFLFDVLGIPKSRVMSGVNAMASFGVYPMPQRCGNTFTHLLHMMRRIVHTRLGLDPANNVSYTLKPKGSQQQQQQHQDHDKQHKKKKGSESKELVVRTRMPHLLFAERSGLSRMPTNFYALKEQLMKEFEGRLTFDTTRGEGGPRTQIGKFYKADIVLGPHGANLANMMWMRSRMHVIEISAVGDGNMCYYATAGRVGLIHHLLLRGGSKDGKYTLSYALFRQHVVAALEAVERSIAEEMKLHA